MKNQYFGDINDYWKYVLVIQFLPFAKKSEFVKKTTGEIFRRLSVQEIACFQTNKVVFFLIPQADHLEAMRERSSRVTQVWHPEIRVEWHKPEVTRAPNRSIPSVA